MHDLRRGDFRLKARRHRTPEDHPQPLLAPALADTGQARVVGQTLVQAKADELAARDVDLRLPQQPSVAHDPEQKAREHQAHRDLRVDTGPVVVRAIAVRHPSRSRPRSRTRSTRAGTRSSGTSCRSEPVTTPPTDRGSSSPQHLVDRSDRAQDSDPRNYITGTFSTAPGFTSCATSSPFSAGRAGASSRTSSPPPSPRRTLRPPRPSGAKSPTNSVLRRTSSPPSSTTPKPTSSPTWPFPKCVAPSYTRPVPSNASTARSSNAPTSLAFGRRSFHWKTHSFASLPSEDAIARLVGAILVDRNDEWVAQTARYMTLETIATVSDNALIELPAVAA